MSISEILLGLCVTGLVIVYVWPPYYFRGDFRDGRKSNKQNCRGFRRGRKL